MTTGYIQSLGWDCHATGLGVGFDTSINGEKLEPVPGQDLTCISSMSSPNSERFFGIYDTETLTSGDSSMCNGTPTASCVSYKSRARGFFQKLGEKVACLEPDSTEFSAVKLLFDKGCSRQVQPKVKAVHKVLNNEVKKRAFADQVCEMDRTRGDARLQYAWYEASADEVFSVVMYGFGQSSMSGGAGSGCGNGVHFVPCTQTDRTARKAAKNVNKEHHLILCEVILGESEVIPRGSQVSLPSSLSFDSGTDSLSHPSTYVIWFPFSNSHVIPWYVFSFTAEEVRPQRPSCAVRRFSSNRTTPYPLAQVPTRAAQVVQKLFPPSDPRTSSKFQWLNILASPMTPSGLLPPLASPSDTIRRDLDMLAMFSSSPMAASRANSSDIFSTTGSEEDDASSVDSSVDRSGVSRNSSLAENL